LLSLALHRQQIANNYHFPRIKLIKTQNPKSLPNQQSIQKNSEFHRKKKSKPQKSHTAASTHEPFVTERPLLSSAAPLLAVLAFVFVASGLGGEPEPLLQKRGLSRLFKNSEISALVAAAVVVILEKALEFKQSKTKAKAIVSSAFSVLASLS
jgi:hypothetical protein